MAQDTTSGADPVIPGIPPLAQPEFYIDHRVWVTLRVLWKPIVATTLIIRKRRSHSSSPRMVQDKQQRVQDRAVIPRQPPPPLRTGFAMSTDCRSTVRQIWPPLLAILLALSLIVFWPIATTNTPPAWWNTMLIIGIVYTIAAFLVIVGMFVWFVGDIFVLSTKTRADRAAAEADAAREVPETRTVES